MKSRGYEAGILSIKFRTNVIIVTHTCVRAGLSNKESKSVAVMSKAFRWCQPRCGDVTICIWTCCSNRRCFIDNVRTRLKSWILMRWSLLTLCALICVVLFFMLQLKRKLGLDHVGWQCASDSFGPNVVTNRRIMDTTTLNPVDATKKSLLRPQTLVSPVIK